MAKRFTETNKWKDDWYLSLSNDYRIVWQYLVDNCSIAGVWEKGFKALNYFCNTNISEKEFNEVFKGRCIEIGDKYFIPKFLKVQNPSGISSNKPAVVSIRKEVDSHNLTSLIKEWLGNDYLMIKEPLKNDRGMIKGIGIGIVKDRGVGKGKKFIPPSKEEFLKYFADNNFNTEIGARAWHGYHEAAWIDTQGTPIRNWKQKCQNVWFKPENKVAPKQPEKPLITSAYYTEPHKMENDERIF